MAAPATVGVFCTLRRASPDFEPAQALRLLLIDHNATDVRVRRPRLTEPDHAIYRFGRPFQNDLHRAIGMLNPRKAVAQPFGEAAT